MIETYWKTIVFVRFEANASGINLRCILHLLMGGLSLSLIVL